MSSITTQKAKLDLELVPKEKRLEIGKYNGRINPGKTQREPTFQVVLNDLALTPCYYAFLTTTDVPEVYMHQLWDSIDNHDTFYRFHLDKKKKFYLNLETFRDVFQICPRVPGQDFDELSTDEMHQPWRTFDTVINRSLSGKITDLDKLRLSRAQILWGMYYKKNVDYVEQLLEDFTYQIDNRVSPKEPIKKSKRVKRPANKSTNVSTAGVVIKDTLGVSVSKKKAPAKADRGKGIEVLLDAALLEEAQLKKTLKKSKQETHKLQASGSSEGADFESEVPDESKAKSSDTIKGIDSDDDNESDDNNDKGSENDDDSGNDAQDSKRTDLDEKENPNLNLNDVNVRSKVTEHEEVGKGDVKMTDATRKSGSQEKSYHQVVEEAHVTLTTSQKTKGSKQSSSWSSDFASKFLIFDNVPPVVDEVASMMNVKVRQEESSTQAPPLLSVPVTAIPESSIKAQEEKDRYINLVEKSVKDIIKDEVKGQLPQILPKKSVQVAKPEFVVADSDMPHNQEGNLGNDDEEPMREVSSKHDWFTKPKQPQEPTNPVRMLARLLNKDQLKAGPTFKLLKVTRINFAELEYDFEVCYKALSEKLDWDNPEGGNYPFDLTKPLPLVTNGSRQIVPVDYFFNNNLKYLQGGSSTMTDTNSTTKTKAA
uniref:Monodehydroascorbate reductase n=1 Tax=Tanacetum cinerariifolium TaxID=118510 RepID=A0A6L2LQ76_TANCI|nr:hypothetical protein [Tanacetum cinerariifolium]